jgi:small neutral amino acid transporter SnatA (MarC family)
VSQMSRRDALLLRFAALWTVLIWAVFVRNLLGDETREVGFKVVHLTLAVVSVGFALAIWRVASRSERRERERAGTPS